MKTNEENAKRNAQKWKKKYYRLGKKIEKQKNKTEDSPKSKVNEMLGKNSVSEEVKRELIFNEALHQQIKINYKNLGQDKKKKRICTTFLTGKVIRKYRFLNKSRFGFGSYKLFKENRSKNNESKRAILRKKMKEEVVNFLEKDCNTTLCPGKKDCITKDKIKKQKRYLNGTLKELHAKFMEDENTTVKVR